MLAVVTSMEKITSSISITLLLMIASLTTILSTVEAFSVINNPNTYCNNNNNLVFSTVTNTRHSTSSRLQSSTTAANVVDSIYIEQAKEKLINTALRLKDEYGVFLFEKSAIDELKSSLDVFDKVTTMTRSKSTYIPEIFAGEWELVVTTAVSTEGIEIPDFIKNQGPLKSIRDSIRTTANKYVRVQQIVSSNIDQIDHVIEYDPPSVLQDVLSNLPEQLMTFNINPLQVSKSKLILQHRATVDSSVDPFLTKLSLTKVILNVAGTSTILDPAGKDITSLPVPFGDLMNAGEFTTSFMDDTVRISRGKQGFVDQLRIFIKRGGGSNNNTFKKSPTPTDVDDFVDPEFDGDIESPSDVEVL